MALDAAPLLLRQRKFAFKTETTTGTYESLAVANAVTRTLNPRINYDIETIDRDDEVSLSDSAPEFGARSANVTFQTWLHGAGTAGDPYWATHLLPACGMVGASGVYTPVTGATSTLSMGCYYAGVRAKYAVGCMGTAVFTLTRGQHVTADWTFTGKHKAPAADSLSAVTYDTITSPRVAAVFTIGAVTYRVPEVQIDLGNTVILREDVTDATGYRAAYITDRSPRVRVSPESLGLGTKNWYADHLAGTTAAMTLTVGDVANNIITFSFPKLILNTPPNEEDRTGMLVDALEFRPIRNSDTGNDEYSITLT